VSVIQTVKKKSDEKVKKVKSARELRKEIDEGPGTEAEKVVKHRLFRNSRKAG